MQVPVVRYRTRRKNTCGVGCYLDPEEIQNWKSEAEQPLSGHHQIEVKNGRSMEMAEH